MKKILALLLAAILALGLVACGTKDDTSLGDGEELVGDDDVKAYGSFKYDTGSDGYYEIVGYTYNGTEAQSLEIPAEISGMPVTSIGDAAFKANTNVVSVSIPTSVKKIGEYAFYGCTGLTEVVIPNSVTEICVGAFSDCTNLKKLTLSEGLVTIGNNAFWRCGALEGVTFSDKLTQIGEGAFFECVSLTEVSIPASVEKIGRAAFNGCSQLAKATINGKSVELYPELSNGETEIQDLRIFDGCKAGMEIVAPKGSTAEEYAAKAGITFTELAAAN